MKFQVGDRVVVKTKLDELAPFNGLHGYVQEYRRRPIDYLPPYQVRFDDGNYALFYARELDKEEQDGKAE